jgi:serpin B
MTFLGGIKMKTLKCIILAGTLSVCIPCSASDPNQKTIVEGSNKFALALYGKLESQGGNLFLSPYSISTALAMTCAGARGQTEKQMVDTLFSAPLESEQINKSFGEIIRQLNAQGEKGGYELVVANALWGQNDYKFLPEYLSVVKTNYDGNLEQVDFKTQAEAARKEINAWVESKTKDKIKDLIKPGMVDTMTRLVLTNAIYFKGKWETQFKPGETLDLPFTLLKGETVKVPIMHQMGKFAYMETNDIQVLDLPYVNKDLSMIVLLPKKSDGVKELEKTLTIENFNSWHAKLQKQEVIVLFPRFKMTSEFELSKVLGEMGMPDAFSGNADFSGMTGKRDFSISGVVHKAYADVNEVGTEAAAATGVIMKATSVGQPPPVFKADHPFIFLIRDNQTGSILFLGRVANPASKGN